MHQKAMTLCSKLYLSTGMPLISWKPRPRTSSSRMLCSFGPSVGKLKLSRITFCRATCKCQELLEEWCATHLDTLQQSSLWRSAGFISLHSEEIKTEGI